MLRSIYRRSFFIGKSRSCSYSSKTAPFRTAIIGSGPAGFYTAYRLLDKLPGAHVDIFESLPVPYGLSRFGVAPDHPEVKNCQDKFEQVAETMPNFQYFGNVTVGKDVTIESLKDNYNCIVLAYGSSEGRHLGVDGENNPGVFSARDFVGWYNGLPSQSNKVFPLDQAEDVVIVGNGNVALDVARILSCDLDRIRSTDITEHSYDQLKKSKIKNIRIVARRGILQSAFTIKELRELIREPNVYFEPLDKSYFEPYSTFLSVLARPKKRLMQLLQKIPQENEEKSMTWKVSSKRVRLDYLLSPDKFISSITKNAILSSIRFERNKLIQDDIEAPVTVERTGEMVSFKSELAFKSIGYKAHALDGFENLQIPFDDKSGTIKNEFGRVKEGIYVSGWVKSGPTGVIAETMRESFEVAETIIADYYQNKVNKDHKAGSEKVLPLIKSKFVSWQDWKKIDAIEQERGQKVGKSRIKMTSVDEMLATLD